MKEIVNLNKENIYSFMNSIEYGTNLVTFEDITSRAILYENIELLNEVLGPGAIELNPFINTEIVNGQYVDAEVEGVFNVLYRNRSQEIPQLTKTDYCLKNFLKSAISEKTRYELKLDERLHKYAAKLAKRNGIKFGSNEKGQYFEGSEKAKPILRQLEEAYDRGDECIVFDTKDVSIHTVRCYASTLGSINGEKFSCEAAYGKLTVYFVEKPKISVHKKRFFDMYHDIAKEIGNNESELMLQELIKSVVPDYKKWKDHPVKVMSGEMTYNEFLNDTTEKIADHYGVPLEELLQSIPEEETETERDHEAEALEYTSSVRNIEGLQQYYIPELEENDTVNTDILNYTGDDHIIDEDDDF